MNTRTDNSFVLIAAIFDTAERVDHVCHLLQQRPESSRTTLAREACVLIKDDSDRLVFGSDRAGQPVSQSTIGPLELLVQCMLFPSVWLVIGAVDRVLLDELALAWPDASLVARLVESMANGMSVLCVLVPADEQADTRKMLQPFGGQVHHLALSAQLIRGLHQLSGTVHT